jgi:hypothetical protein
MSGDFASHNRDAGILPSCPLNQGPFQISSGTILIAPHGHSETHSRQPLQ